MLSIYCYTNKINGKCYIGSTTNIKRRKRDHLYETNKKSKRQCLFHRAIDKYGESGFDLVILEETCPLFREEKENYWIQQKNALCPNGYNLILAGSHIFSQHQREIMAEALRKRMKDPSILMRQREIVAKLNSDPDIINKRTESLKHSQKHKKHLQNMISIINTPEAKEKAKATCAKTNKARVDELKQTGKICPVCNLLLPAEEFLHTGPNGNTHIRELCRKHRKERKEYLRKIKKLL